MNIGGITIEMAADLARLRQDMAAAKSSVGEAMAGIEKAVDLAKAAFVGYLGVASINAFKNMVMGAVDATGALHDLSQQTGNSAAALAQFRSIGAYSETTIDAISAASLKLSKNMAMADEEGKGAAVALKAIGVNFSDFQKQSPDERMLTAAKALAQYKDGADKSAAAMLLFGKEGAKMLPFLADLAEQSDQVTGALSEQNVETKKLQAAMADAFGDNLTKISKNSDAWKKDLSLGLLPAMYEASEAFLQMTGGAGGLKAKISELAKDGTFAEWARGAMTALSYLVDVGQGLFNLLPMLGKAIAGVAAGSMELFGNLGDAAKKVLQGDFSGALDSMKNGFSAVSTIGQATADDISKIWNQKLIGETFRDTIDGLKGVQAQTKSAGKDMESLGGIADEIAEAKKREAEATKLAAAEDKKRAAVQEAAKKAGVELMAALKLKNEQLQMEVDLGRKLTPVELENLKVTRDLAGGKVALTREERDAVRTTIEHSGALEEDVAWMQEARKQNLAAIESTGKRIDQLRDETEKQRQSNAEMLLSAQQVGELRQAKLLDLAASADRKAALLDEIDWTGQLGDQQRELAQAYRDSADAARDGAAVKAAKEAQDAWQKTIDSIGQGLTDSLYRAFESGKGFFSTLWDGIKNTFKTTVLKVAVQGVMGAIGLGGAGAAAAATGAGNALGGLGSLAGLANAASSVWDFASTNGMAWLTDFGGSVGTLTSSLGGKLFDAGFEKLGNLIGGAQGTISELASMGGDLLGYGSALLAATKGQYGAAAGSAIGTYFGGPIGATIGNILGGFVDKLFGGGHNPHSGAGIYSDGTSAGTVNVKNAGYGLGGAYGDSVNKYYNDGIAKALTTLSTGSAAMLNDLSKAFGGAGGFGVGTYFASDGDRGSNWGRSVLKDGKVQSYFFGNDLDKDPTKGLQQLTDALAGQVRSAMAQINLPDWAREQLAALGANATMDQLAQAVQMIKQAQLALTAMGDAVAPLGGVFSRIGGLSSDAQMQLAQFAGGIDAFISKTQSFVKNYYSTDEQNAIAAQQIQKALDAAGITTSLGSRDDFKALVMGSDEQTEAGRQQLAVLLSLNEAFAPVADYLQAQGKTLAELAAQAPQVAALQAMTDATTQQVNVQQEASDRLVQLDDTFNSVGANLGAKLESLTTSVQAGLAQVAANTAEMSRRFARWDGGDGLNTVAPT